MLYKRLSLEEFNALEKDFVKFLAMHSIAATEWERLKKEDTDKMNFYLDAFSDFVYDTALSNIQFIEHQEAKVWHLFHCKKEKIHLLGIELESDVYSFYDIGKTISQEDFVQKIQNNDITIRTFQLEKDYNPNRNQEIFKMLNEGCTIIQEKAYWSLFYLINPPNPN